ncbi:ribosomal RNA processing protein 36 homolog [Phymastichus coffea]|uniref:ribosomal RNA processing protein 36 homolog n=1 Tax=Phymastichus coffea TaxID=108790 RepID=UPI00273BBEAC|nr:ribosomal RNA processing protein 36 homolog [Phymastichus coffea]
MSSDEEDALLNEDKDQAQIKKELSQMSFADLQKLKEKLGTKVYNATMFGAKKSKLIKFKRENKNRPREESSKRQVTRFREVVPVKKKEPRDPRFDSLCGTYDEKAFKNAYSFLSEIKQNDLKSLKKELQTEEDPKQIKKIKYLIQRLENQIREEKKKSEKEMKQKEEKQEILSAIRSGEKPKYKKKSEKRLTNLVSQYEDLKNSGKLIKHIQRIRKKNLKKDRVQLENSISE